MQTLTEIEACEREMLVPADIAPILGSDPQTIRLMAHQCREQLGFPVTIIGNRVKIPRAAFLAFMRGEKTSC